MKISEFSKTISNIEIINDVEIDSLGMATTVFKSEEVLSFLEDTKYIKAIIDNENITAIITTREIYEKIRIPDYLGVVISCNPKITFYEIHNILSENDFYWKKFENKIAKTAVISNGSFIEEHSVEIGENSIIEPGVVIHSGSIIGNNVTVRSGSNIGTAGFQFLNTNGIVISVKTAGKTIIKDNVEIQHNCCVDRGVLGGDTLLNEYVKLDNFVHIAHDNVIGARTFITAGAKLAGRVIVGRNCWIGVNSTISNGIKIGDNCKITLGSVVTQNIPDGSIVSGNFAIDHQKFIKFIKSIR
ncbi:UDP-3-O-(3-hydroxymyristoyl)glucosamine N-acyltransferase [Proteocatella sphenisci]|uniref:UDP-3-O-(3-hydroxymyristoyl)glucosamine N-acyltransferase n=1 Tax=Proteocatella sphenisci TaxID=181070 RepID=UPI00048F374C|nr:UDP-3-O-(3-hydroxymyristoyl)glucosamine N-acyltransferase [Proteocatella sphenisci]